MGYEGLRVRIAELHLKIKTELSRLERKQFDVPLADRTLAIARLAGILEGLHLLDLEIDEERSDVTLPGVR